MKKAISVLDPKANIADTKGVYLLARP